MRKYRIKSVIVALFAMTILAVFQSGGAEAASNGNHDQEFTCTTNATSGGAGTTFTSVFSYHVTGVGTSSANRVYPDQWSWHTDPSALLDQVQLSLGDTSGGPGTVMKIYGTGSQNGVSSSWTTTSFPASSTTWSNGTPGNISVDVWGGVGNGAGYCHRDRNVL